MLPLVLVLAILLTPVVEIYTIIQVGHALGGWPTLALLAAETAVGALIVRREGRRAWRALNDTLQRGVLPDRELADAALIMAGGVLLLIPGFVTDAVGFLLVLPFTRPLVRSALARYAGRRARAAGAADGPRVMFAPGPVFPPADGGGASRDGVPSGPVVRGEIVDDDTP
ncbi:FxsA family protein [Spirillospora albida]|uniref:FxsA family protein n=1 Tax=Spirillospora albida TaxID=58123 RepID=UPI00068D0714|nr:FxsA family protein [Spirillospora albida]